MGVSVVWRLGRKSAFLAPAPDLDKPFSLLASARKRTEVTFPYRRGTAKPERLKAPPPISLAA